MEKILLCAENYEVQKYRLWLQK